MLLFERYFLIEFIKQQLYIIFLLDLLLGLLVDKPVFVHNKPILQQEDSHVHHQHYPIQVGKTQLQIVRIV